MGVIQIMEILLIELQIRHLVTIQILKEMDMEEAQKMALHAQ